MSCFLNTDNSLEPGAHRLRGNPAKQLQALQISDTVSRRDEDLFSGSLLIIRKRSFAQRSKQPRSSLQFALGQISVHAPRRPAWMSCQISLKSIQAVGDVSQLCKRPLRNSVSLVYSTQTALEFKTRRYGNTTIRAGHRANHRSAVFHLSSKLDLLSLWKLAPSCESSIKNRTIYTRLKCGTGEREAVQLCPLPSRTLW